MDAVRSTLGGVTERSRATALQRWLIEERQRRAAAEEAFKQTSIESAARSDALYRASYLVDSSAELAELVGLDSSTVRGLILKSAEREQDMEVYRAGFKALGMPLPEREYGRKLARKLLARVERPSLEGVLAAAVSRAKTQAGDAAERDIAEAAALATWRLDGSR